MLTLVMWESWLADLLSFELTHPNTYPIYELLDGVKGLVLQIQSWRMQGQIQRDKRWEGPEQYRTDCYVWSEYSF